MVIEKTDWFKKWLIAGRPWSLPASSHSVFGASLAATVGWVKLQIELASFITAGHVIFLHMAANMLSDVVDWKQGSFLGDNSGQLGPGRGLLTPRTGP